MMFNERVTMRFRRGVALGLALGVLSVSGLRTAQAQAPNTGVVIFAVELDWEAVTDNNEDGIPELPSLSVEDLHGIRFGQSPDAVTNLHFLPSSPPCGSYDVAGESFTSDMAAYVIHRGKPYSALVYPMQPQKPAYHSLLLSDDIVDAHVCWAKEDSFGQVSLQEEFDADSTRVFAFVTAWVRVAE